MSVSVKPLLILSNRGCYRQKIEEPEETRRLHALPWLGSLRRNNLWTTYTDILKTTKYIICFRICYWYFVCSVMNAEQMLEGRRDQITDYEVLISKNAKK